MIVSFEQMLEKAKQGEPMVLAGAAAQDVDTIKAMAAAEEAGMIRPILVGDIPTIERVMKEEGVTSGMPSWSRPMIWSKPAPRLSSWFAWAKPISS